MTSVRLYTTGSACPNCERTRQILTRAGIRYVETNLRDKPDALSYVTDDLGYSEAPVVIVDGDPQNHWSGFRPDLIRNLAHHATQQTPVPLEPITSIGRN